MRRDLLIALLLLASPGASVAAAPDPLALGAVRLQLFYAQTGTLSRNIAPPAKVDLWNTGAGEGDAGGAASDALVTVPIVARTATAPNTPAAPVTLRVRDATGKVLAARTFAPGYVFVPPGGRTVLALWVHDIACAGKVTLEATYRAQRTSAVLSFDCGE